MLYGCYLAMAVFSDSTVLALSKYATVSLVGPAKTINKSISRADPVNMTKRNISVVGPVNRTGNYIHS
jgi:hypothetical protein